MIRDHDPGDEAPCAKAEGDITLAAALVYCVATRITIGARRPPSASAEIVVEK
jgi:hypothetical protein